MKRLNSRSLRYAVESRRMGDDVLLPHLPPADTFVKAMNTWLLRQNLPHALQQSRCADIVTGGEVDIFSGDFSEPVWAKTLPPILRRSLNNNRTLHTIDPLGIMSELPFTGLWYIVERGGITQEVIQYFNLNRLHGVHQLGLLHGAVVPDENRTQQHHVSARYPHTRGMHVIDVRTVVGLIARRNNFSHHDMIKLLFCGLTHDALTPAGGDTTKLIDGTAFDEDLHYREFLQGPAWNIFKAKHHLSKDELVEIINNHGVLGTILDIADKVAYISRDTHYYLAYNSAFHKHYQTGLKGYDKILAIVKQDPLVCGIWDAVVVIDGRMVIRHPQRLLRFLKLRTLLGKHLYWHPGARITEFLFSVSIMKELYDKGTLTREMLLRFTDNELSAHIGKVLGDKYFNLSFSLFLEPYIELFNDAESAQQRKEELRHQGITLAFIEKAPSILVTHADTFWVLHKGKIMPLIEAFPDQVAEIEDEAIIQKPYRLLWIRDEQLDHPLRNALDRAQERIDNKTQ